MKKNPLTLLILSLLVFSSCNNSLYNLHYVGYVKKNNYIISNFKDSIITCWNNDLLANKIIGKIESLEIKKGKDEYRNKPYYYLYGHSKNDSIKMGGLLKLKMGRFYFLKDVNMTVICSGCSSSYPKYEYDDWGWGCESKEVNTDCKKTVIVKY